MAELYEKIFISPSNQEGNAYAYGKTNEAEQCGKIGKALEKALTRCGFQTKLEQYLTAQQRCKDSDAWGADLHLPIHSNAYNGKVSGTRVFYYSAGKSCAQCIYDFLAPITPGTSENVSQNTTWIETKNPKAMSVYIEVEFHDVAACAKWIIEHTTEIAEAICKGICKYYKRAYVPPVEEKEQGKPDKLYRVQVGAFALRSNAEAYREKLAKDGYIGFIVE